MDPTLRCYSAVGFDVQCSRLLKRHVAQVLSYATGCRCRFQKATAPVHWAGVIELLTGNGRSSMHEAPREIGIPRSPAIRN